MYSKHHKSGLNKTQLSQIDGLDMWSCISEADKCSRTELVYNIDDIADYGAIRVNDWKYIYGSTNNGRADRWFGNSGKSDKYVYDIEAVLSSKVATSLAGVITQRQIKEKGVNLYINLLNEKTLLRLRQESTIKCAEVNEKFQSSLYQCDLLQSPCLFNISNDPCEQINLLQDKSVEVTKLVQKLVTYRKTIVKARNAPRDPKANPINWKNTWINWKDYENIETKKQIINYPSIPAVGLLGATVVTILFIVTTLIILKLKKSKICKGGRNNNCWFGNFEERDEEIIPNRKGSFFESRELQSQVYLKQNIRTVY
ncbi:hypothetical protein NQ315_014761 [Exocentrus adspersus]|uniref:Uncharacterized protein n=1 Tax=Exocentrus adspersus TaxID=1586481 RepID=A0AAV8VMK1_9CUCU|nr:hypothetical protein NQ315_014761 [Exocentrus adspersus]